MIKDCSRKIVPDYVRMTFLVAALLPVLLTWTAVMRNVKAIAQENAVLTPVADERDKSVSTADTEHEAAVQRHVIRQPFGGTQDRTPIVERSVTVDEPDQPLLITAAEQLRPILKTGDHAATAIRLVRHVASGNFELDEPLNDLELLETKKVTASDDEKTPSTLLSFSGAGQNYYEEIRPTKTQSMPEDRSNFIGADLPTGGPGTGPDSSVFEQHALPAAGEANRASSRGRSLPVTGPATANATTISDYRNATTPDESIRKLTSSARLSGDLFRPISMDSAAATGEPADRKHPNGDIQDIVNGFIKLLNGNVAVQVNTDLPPKSTGTPAVRTRINNRGPPRISDVPPLFFETAASHQPSSPNAIAATPSAPDVQQSVLLKEGHPYPFDVPLSLPPQPSNIVRPYVSGIPIPQLIVPVVQQSNVTTIATTSPADVDNGDRKTTASSSTATQSDRGTTFILISNITSSPTASSLSSSSSDKPSSNKTSNEKSPTANKISNQPAATKNKTSADKIPIVPDKLKWKDDGAPVQRPLSSVGNVTKVEDSVQSTNKSTESAAQSKVDTVHSSSKTSNANVSSLITPTSATGFQSPFSSPLPSQISTGTNISSGEDHDTRPTTGIGTAVVVLEPSTQEVPSHQDAHKVTAVPPGVSSTVKRRPPLPSSSLHHQHHADGSGYFPRPGIVLDDLEYKPAAGGNSGHNRRPGPIHSAAGAAGVGIITAAVAQHNKDIFDVTVSAIQGPSSVDPNDTNSAKLGQPYIYPVDIDTGLLTTNGNNIDSAVITAADQPGQNFVSIDGKRTYLNLFETNNVATHAIASIQPTHVKNHGWQGGAHASTANNFPPTGGHGSPPSPASSAVNNSKPPGANNANNNGNAASGKPASSLPSTSPAWRKPAHPAIRIDTCIVGDDSTCDAAQHEICRTEGGVSSCHCRPSYNRRKHREPCHRVVSLFLTLRVDRMYDQHLSWNDKYTEPDSSEYQQLEYEANKAIDSALSMTPFSDLFLGARVNNIYTSRNGNSSPPVFVNLTIQLSESSETLRAPVKQDLQKHLMGVIHRRSNNIGSSPLWVDSPNGAISQIHDVDECASADLNDCHSTAKCTNIFGSFYCVCPEGYRDPWAGNNHRSGRMCEKCDPSNCNHRGECSFQNGQPVCKCTGSYYGSQCEIDGEVLGVAIGSSVIAVLIIVTTLACLCAWSRRWNKEQKIGSPIFGYMPTGGSTVKTPVVGAPPYQVSLEDRLRWAQIADAMAHANHYGPEPVGTLRPSSSIFGYSLPHSNGPLIMPRLRAPSVHTLRTPESSTSEEEDRADLLGRQFQVPRPKSRSSVANQSGIYYDVDYESQQQSGEIFSTIKSGQPPCIPLNTYTMGSRSHYYRS